MSIFIQHAYHQKLDACAPALKDYEPHPNDAVLLAKELVNSSTLSQPPTVVLPVDFLSRLAQPLGALPRNALADRARKEFPSIDIYSQTILFLD